MLSHGQSITLKAVHLRHENDHKLLASIETFGTDDLAHTLRNKLSHTANFWIPSSEKID